MHVESLKRRSPNILYLEVCGVIALKEQRWKMQTDSMKIDVEQDLLASSAKLDLHYFL